MPAAGAGGGGKVLRVSEQATAQRQSPAGVDEGPNADPLASAKRLVELLQQQALPLAEDVFRLHGVLAAAAKRPSDALAALLLSLTEDPAASRWMDTRDRRTSEVAVQLMLRMGYPYAFQLTPEQLSLAPEHPHGHLAWPPLALALFSLLWLGLGTLLVAAAIGSLLATDVWGDLGGDASALTSVLLGGVLSTAYAARSVALARVAVPEDVLREQLFLGAAGFGALILGAFWAGGGSSAARLALAFAPVAALTASTGFRWLHRREEGARADPRGPLAP